MADSGNAVILGCNLVGAMQFVIATIFLSSEKQVLELQKQLVSIDD